MEEQEKELNPLERARAEFNRKHPEGISIAERSKQAQKTQSPPTVEKTPPPVVEQTTKNDNEKKSAPADPEPNEKKEGEEKKEKPRKRRRTREEIRADLQKRRDELNAQLAEMRAEDAKAERKQRNHRLITFGARFEKEIMAVCKNGNRQEDDQAIKNLSAELYKKLFPTDTEKEERTKNGN